MARSTRLTVVADTGAIYALIDASDAWHVRVSEWWKDNRSPVVLPAAILPEVSYLLQTRIDPSAEEAFIRSVAEDEFSVDSVGDHVRIADLMREYADLPLSFVDASVVAMTESYETRKVLTTDRRHFGVVRPRHTRSLELLP